MTFKAINRKKYLRIPKTIPFDLGATNYIQLSGLFNQLNFSLRGTITRSAVGTSAGKDILEAIERLEINSSIHGKLCDIDGSQLYFISRSLFATTSFTSVGTGTTVEKVGYEAALPFSCDENESLTITVTWTSSFARMGTNITSYTGVLRVNAEMLPYRPELKFAYRKQIMGASGVIGANVTYSQPTIPIIDGFLLNNVILETRAVVGASTVWVDTIDRIELTHGAGNYIIDEKNEVLKMIAGIEIFKALDDGITRIMFNPFQHSAETLLNIINGGTATTSGSQILYQYVNVRAVVPTPPPIPTPPALVPTPAPAPTPPIIAPTPPPVITPPAVAGVVARPRGALVRALAGI